MNTETKRLMLTLFNVALFFGAAGVVWCGSHIKHATGVVEYVESDEFVLGSDFHLGLPHNVGDPREDANGCPCLCVHCGFSSYAICTNAVAHGFDSIWEYMPSKNGIVVMHPDTMKNTEAEILRIIANFEREREALMERGND